MTDKSDNSQEYSSLAKSAKDIKKELGKDDPVNYILKKALEGNLNLYWKLPKNIIALYRLDLKTESASKDYYNVIKRNNPDFEFHDYIFTDDEVRTFKISNKTLLFDPLVKCWMLGGKVNDYASSNYDPNYIQSPLLLDKKGRFFTVLGVGITSGVVNSKGEIDDVADGLTRKKDLYISKKELQKLINDLKYGQVNSPELEQKNITGKTTKKLPYQVRKELKNWIEKKTKDESNHNLNKSDFFNLAMNELTSNFTQNLFNETWRIAETPVHFKKPGRRQIT
jgi:hypothetical protein